MNGGEPGLGLVVASPLDLGISVSWVELGAVAASFKLFSFFWLRKPTVTGSSCCKSGCSKYVKQKEMKNPRVCNATGKPLSPRRASLELYLARMQSNRAEWQKTLARFEAVR